MTPKILVPALFIIVTLSTLLIIVALIMALFFNKEEKSKVQSPEHKITEIREFSCEGMTGFSFKYPVFKGWEVKSVQKTSENGCTIWLNHPNGIEFEVPPQINIAKIIDLNPEIDTLSGKPYHNPAYVSVTPVKKNPQGVDYNFVYDPSLYVEGHEPEPGEWDYIHFYGDKFGVRIWVFSISEEAGFSVDDFAKEIVKSLVIGRSPESVNAKNLVESDSLPVVYSTAGITGRESAIEQEIKDVQKIIISELQKDNENPSEFYATVFVEQKFGTVGEVLDFSLWHQSAFLKENWNVQGNPGGKCRDFYYDTNQKKITDKLFWQ